MTAPTRTRTVSLEIVERACASCGRWFRVQRRSALYCGAVCRVRAMRARRKQFTEATVPRDAAEGNER